MKKIYAASAVAPCTTHIEAMKHIASGLSDPKLGKISADKVQLCPQHAGCIDENLIDRIMTQYPKTQFRLHASPKIRGEGRQIVYASNAAENKNYINRAIKMNKTMRSDGYSIHAGRREHMTMAKLLEEAQRIQEKAPDIRMSVEGLYPDRRDQWLVSTWAEYEQLADSGLGFALDLSHLNIVVKQEGRQDNLVENMAALPNCVEIHVSHNNGRADTHKPVPKDQSPWWLTALQKAHHLTDIFYEGILVAPKR